MKKMKNTFLISGLFIATLFIFSCGDKDKDNTPSSTENGKIAVNFQIYNEGSTQKYYNPIYTNAAGNVYEVWDVQFFISRLTLYKNGKEIILNKKENGHYFDDKIISTQKWNVEDEITPGTYDSIAFTFGFNDADNIDMMYLNAPENAMFWPTTLGGGYHYMKLNGKWKGTNDSLLSFNIHIGRGQDSLHQSIDNSFKVVFPNSKINIVKGATKEVIFRMNVEEWFKDPEVYDFNVYRGGIMMNEEAMSKICRNGWNAFTMIN